MTMMATILKNTTAILMKMAPSVTVENRHELLSILRAAGWRCEDQEIKWPYAREKQGSKLRKDGEGERERESRRYKTVREKEMEAIAGPGMEIKAVLHEINGGLHKQYMNHSPPLQWGRENERESKTEADKGEQSCRLTNYDFKRSFHLTKLHNTSDKVTEEEEPEQVEE